MAVTLRAMSIPFAGAVALLTAGAADPQPAQPSAVPGARHISRGWEIPSRGYAGQPYIVQTDDGAWLCGMTTGAGREGDPGQTVVAMRSADRGRTWSEPVLIEPVDDPEASYAVLLKAPFGQICRFSNHNTDNAREVKREGHGVYQRVDSLGRFAVRYSDDQGRIWSERPYEVPIRKFECDRNNVYGGRLRFFRNVDRPLVLGHETIMVLHKVGAMGDGLLCPVRWRVLREPQHSDRTRYDPACVRDAAGWRHRPSRAGGRVAGEQSIAKLSDGSLFCVYRTIDGWPAQACSRDAGRTWTTPAYMPHARGGRRVKHPRAANFARKVPLHNHGGRLVGDLGAAGKNGRNLTRRLQPRPAYGGTRGRHARGPVNRVVQARNSFMTTIPTSE